MFWSKEVFIRAQQAKDRVRPGLYIMSPGNGRQSLDPRNGRQGSQSSKTIDGTKNTHIYFTYNSDEIIHIQKENRAEKAKSVSLFRPRGFKASSRWIQKASLTGFKESFTSWSWLNCLATGWSQFLVRMAYLCSAMRSLMHLLLCGLCRNSLPHTDMTGDISRKECYGSSLTAVTQW